MTDSNNCIQSVQVSGLPLKVSSFSVGRVPDEIGVVINFAYERDTDNLPDQMTLDVVET